MLSLKHGKISDKSSTGCKDSLSFDKEAFQPKAHSYMHKRVLRLYASDCLLVIDFVSLENPD